MSKRDLRVRNEDVELAGTLYLPTKAGPRATLLMVGGSGPTDRDNDVYFPPIRERLLDAGVAVASFDKRGVGESTGDWHDGGPAELTADALVELAHLRTQSGIHPGGIGVFGHSQGGWVAMEVAAADRSTAFVITNSGPGVSPYRQERYAVEAGMRADGRTEDEIAHAMAKFEDLAQRIRDGAPVDAFEGLANEPSLQRYTLVPSSPEVLRMMRAWIDHDPRPALERLSAPMLAVFGSADRIVPVDDSLAVMREAREGRPGGLTTVIIEEGDHRSQVGDPPRLPQHYHETVASWIAQQL